jgi:rhamnosyltransferase
LRTLQALSTQTVAHELLVCDSGSLDGSPDLARAHGARVIAIDPESFSHGGTRNLLMREAGGTHVALLSQDAEPQDDDWLERLLDAFALGSDVAIVYGPYRPRPEASLAVRVELERWFGSLSPDAQARVDRLAPDERSLPAGTLIGVRGFFTDANACLARAAWERVPFRDVPYAEDRVLAIDMLRHGYAKVFAPGAAVWHSHDLSTLGQLRRSFDEWRALSEVYGWREPANPRHLARQLRGALGQARSDLIREGSRRRMDAYAGVGLHHLARLTGALLGSRAERLPPAVRRRLSLEGRATVLPLELDTARIVSAEESPVD